MSCWVDRARVPFEFYAAGSACPNVLIVDGVCVFGRDVNVAVAEEGGSFLGPWKRRGVSGECS